MNYLIVLLALAFPNPLISNSRKTLAQDGNRIEYSETGCEGAYISPEFVNGSDVPINLNSKARSFRHYRRNRSQGLN